MKNENKIKEATVNGHKIWDGHCEVTIPPLTRQNGHCLTKYTDIVKTQVRQLTSLVSLLRDALFAILYFSYLLVDIELHLSSVMST